MSHSIFKPKAPAYENLIEHIEAHSYRSRPREQSIDLGKRQAGPSVPSSEDGMVTLFGSTMGKPAPSNVRKSHMTRNQRHLL